MKLPYTNIKQNADGTITCFYGKRRGTITPQEWWTEEETFERCKWELVSLGLSLAPPELDKHTQGLYNASQRQGGTE